jgi:hypothetical protein
MQTEPVRVSVDITWWPEEADYSCSIRVLRRDDRSGQWMLEEMRTSASPSSLDGVMETLADNLEDVARWFRRGPF